MAARRPVVVEVHRTDRKRSVAFEVRLPNTMIVAAPRRLDTATINRLAEARLAWAAKRLEAVEAGYARHGLPKLFRGGEKFPLLGCDLLLTVVETSDVSRCQVVLANERLLATVRPAPPEVQELKVKEALLKWYRRTALEALQTSVDKWAPVVGAAPRTVSVRNQRRRWGSCSRGGCLNFNWRLAMTPAGVLDYVVVHELCHLIEPNHSSRYWQLVGRVMPDHAEHRLWLKDNGVLLESCS